MRLYYKTGLGDPRDGTVAQSLKNAFNYGLDAMLAQVDGDEQRINWDSLCLILQQEDLPSYSDVIITMTADSKGD